MIRLKYVLCTRFFIFLRIETPGTESLTVSQRRWFNIASFGRAPCCVIVTQNIGGGFLSVVLYRERHCVGSLFTTRSVQIGRDTATTGGGGV